VVRTARRENNLADMDQKKKAFFPEFARKITMPVKTK
jgi:hypothetical protein